MRRKRPVTKVICVWHGRSRTRRTGDGYRLFLDSVRADVGWNWVWSIFWWSEVWVFVTCILNQTQNQFRTHRRILFIRRDKKPENQFAFVHVGDHSIAKTKLGAIFLHLVCMHCNGCNSGSLSEHWSWCLPPDPEHVWRHHAVRKRRKSKTP